MVASTKFLEAIVTMLSRGERGWGECLVPTVLATEAQGM